MKKTECLHEYTTCEPSAVASDCPLRALAKNTPLLPLECYDEPQEVNLSWEFLISHSHLSCQPVLNTFLKSCNFKLILVWISSEVHCIETFCISMSKLLHRQRACCITLFSEPGTYLFYYTLKLKACGYLKVVELRYPRVSVTPRTI